MTVIPAARRLEGVDEYYFSRKLREVRRLQDSGHDVLNLGIGNPDMAPDAAALTRLRLSAEDPRHHGYQPHRGVRELRTAIASYMHQEYHVALDPETEILPLLGSKEGITHISLAFLNAGDRVLVPDPGYPTYTSVARLAEAGVLPYRLRPEAGWAPDFAALERTDLSRVRLLWANYPHMPTGAPARPAILENLVAFARKHAILLCHDNPYSHIVHEGSPTSVFSVPGAREVAVELNSLSKSHNMAGWRIGWISGGQDYIEIILRVLTQIESGIFLPLQHAAVEALRAPAAWYAAQRREYAERRALGNDLARALGCGIDEGQTGMFVWARLPAGEPSAGDFVDRLLHDAHLFLAPGTVFGPGGEGYIRISLCASQDILRRAILRVTRGETESKQGGMAP